MSYRMPTVRDWSQNVRTLRD